MMVKHHYPALANLNKEGTAPDGRKFRVTLADEARSFFLQAQDGEQKFNALRQYIFFTWPEFVADLKVINGRPKVSTTNKWNPWLERNLKAFTNSEYACKIGDTTFRFIGLTGCGGGGKTHSAGLYAAAWWMASPHNSIAILTSTTVGMIRHRIWPVIDHYSKNAYDMTTGKVARLERGRQARGVCLGGGAWRDAEGNSQSQGYARGAYPADY
jgi:hypothetical protein